MLLLDFESLVQIGVVGIFTGFGSALGNYLAQRAFIRRLDRLSKKG